MESERNQLQVECKYNSEELARLRQDIKVYTKDNQGLHKEIAKLCGEKEALRKDVEDYCARMLHSEDLLKKKDNEKNELMQSYQNVCVQLRQHELAAQKLQQELDSLRYSTAIVWLTEGARQSRYERQRNKRCWITSRKSNRKTPDMWLT